MDHHTVEYSAECGWALPSVYPAPCNLPLLVIESNTQIPREIHRINVTRVSETPWGVRQICGEGAVDLVVQSSFPLPHHWRERMKVRAPISLAAARTPAGTRASRTMNPHPHPLPRVLRERDKTGSRFITHKFDVHPLGARSASPPSQTRRQLIRSEPWHRQPKTRPDTRSSNTLDS